MKLRRKEMRNWCAALAMSAFLALPLCAQQQNSGASDETANAATAAEKSAASGKAAESSKPAAAKGVFALPATPRPTPFPGPAAAADTRPPGTLLPRFETSAMYDYINFAPGSPFANFNNHGATGSFTYNASKWLGLTAEVGGYHFNRNLFPVTGSNTGVSGGFISYLFGPRLNWRKFGHFVPFGELLVGGMNAGSELVGGQSQNAFALATGGGVDIVLTKNLAWRFAQLDYLMTS
jgi:hypothetical protein